MSRDQAESHCPHCPITQEQWVALLSGYPIDELNDLIAKAHPLLTRMGVSGFTFGLEHRIKLGSGSGEIQYHSSAVLLYLLGSIQNEGHIYVAPVTADTVLRAGMAGIAFLCFQAECPILYQTTGQRLPSGGLLLTPSHRGPTEPLLRPSCPSTKVRP